jgi:hypothetical protein
VGRKTNKQRRQQHAVSARERAAAARQAQQRIDQRRRARNILVTVVTVAVIVVVVALVAINRPTKSNPAGDRVSASPSVLKTVSDVSDTTTAKVGAGNVANPPKKITGSSPLVSGGKPELLYIGAEFCPYCAVERWSLAEALSKFGTLSNLGEVHSAVDDGNYASLDFYKSSYSSPYLTFTPVEHVDRNSKPLQPLTSSENALWSTLDGGPAHEGYPTIDFGGKLALTSAPLDPSVLGTESQQQVAAALNQPTSKIAQTVGGGANDDIAAICTMTGNKPAKVCGTSTIAALETKLAAPPSG